jgi:hypothetical protein
VPPIPSPTTRQCSWMAAGLHSRERPSAGRQLSCSQASSC